MQHLIILALKLLDNLKEKIKILSMFCYRKKCFDNLSGFKDLNQKVKLIKTKKNFLLIRRLNAFICHIEVR